jgi:hypothetical protein
MTVNSNLKCAWSILVHKYFVFVAGLRLKVPVWQLIIHDLSKFSPLEFPYYRKAFFEGQKDALAPGWLHHQNSNLHHWEWWILRGRHKKDSNNPGPVNMPERYIREMIADWFGAGRGYAGSWDMRDWVKKNLPNMDLSETTRKKVVEILNEFDGGIL